MKKRILLISIFFIIVIVVVTVIFGIYEHNLNSNSTINNQIVDINEIEQLYKNGNSELASKKLTDLQEYLRSTRSKSVDYSSLITISSISILFIVAVFAYIYYSILRPFDKLKGFASEISKGNFDLPLEYERGNYFGDFTWAFDSMRQEITKARICEKEAIENNKTVIASLSHDIKTPIASIMAYAEALEANMDDTYEKRVEYTNVIIRKSEEVKKLTDDLFLHSVSDMDRISYREEKVDLLDVIKTSANDFKANSKINFKTNINSAFIKGDKERLFQVFENLINNSIKYANTNIDINLEENNNNYIVNVKDYGPGIDDKDLPFIFEKFYRGNNAIGIQGTGLGLYIVKYMMEKMNGNIEVINDNGLLVKLIFKKDFIS
ncbi:MAG: HAMP domain-containing histidine kinase [bacterium]|nr:HAMP domain-containing histidine kinase [bacterium]